MTKFTNTYFVPIKPTQYNSLPKLVPRKPTYEAKEHNRINTPKPSSDHQPEHPPEYNQL